MRKNKIRVIAIYMILMIMSLCACSNNKEDGNIESKINSEIQYLDHKIIGIMNKLNNITLENYEIKTKEEDTKSQGGQGKSRREIEKR